MRRNNEVLLQQHIEEYMKKAENDISESQLIFLFAPGMNKNIFLSESKSLAAHAHKVRSVIFPS
jgi:hypothetical protein